MNTGQRIVERIEQRFSQTASKVGHGTPLTAEFSRLSGNQIPYPPAAPMRLPFRGTVLVVKETQKRIEEGLGRQTEIMLLLSARDQAYPVPEIGDRLYLYADHFPNRVREFHIEELKPAAPGGRVLMWTLKGLEAGQI